MSTAPPQVHSVRPPPRANASPCQNVEFHVAAGFAVFFFSSLRIAHRPSRTSSADSLQAQDDLRFSDCAVKLPGHSHLEYRPLIISTVACPFPGLDDAAPEHHDPPVVFFREHQPILSTSAASFFVRLSMSTCNQASKILILEVGSIVGNFNFTGSYISNASSLSYVLALDFHFQNNLTVNTPDIALHSGFSMHWLRNSPTEALQLMRLSTLSYSSCCWPVCLLSLSSLNLGTSSALDREFRDRFRGIYVVDARESSSDWTLNERLTNIRVDRHGPPPEVFFDSDPNPSLDHLLPTAPPGACGPQLTDSTESFIPDFAHETLAVLGYSQRNRLVLSTHYVIPLTICGSSSTTAETAVCLLHRATTLVLLVPVTESNTALNTTVSPGHRSRHRRIPIQRLFISSRSRAS
ncbi:hypothetical protein B0H13DRAFT_2380898 [Mycena leptocephala]|nr:hypothetical protein B0H13DRAFT_2380898 [Mycena leptocephala]